MSMGLSAAGLLCWLCPRSARSRACPQCSASTRDRRPCVPSAGTAGLRSRRQPSRPPGQGFGWQSALSLGFEAPGRTSGIRLGSGSSTYQRSVSLGAGGGSIHQTGAGPPFPATGSRLGAGGSLPSRAHLRGAASASSRPTAPPGGSGRSLPAGRQAGQWDGPTQASGGGTDGEEEEEERTERKRDGPRGRGNAPGGPSPAEPSAATGQGLQAGPEAGRVTGHRAAVPFSPFTCGSTLPQTAGGPGRSRAREGGSPGGSQEPGFLRRFGALGDGGPRPARPDGAEGGLLFPVPRV